MGEKTEIGAGKRLSSPAAAAFAIGAACGLWIGPAAVAWAGETQPPPRITMRPPSQNDGAPQIDGGERQALTTWPATLKYFEFGKTDMLCTATIVGERAVITAAHCLPAGAIAEIELAEDKRIAMSCAHHPAYVANWLTSDLALCLTDEAVRPQPRFQFENLSLTLDDVRPQEKLFLLGFGCRDVDNPGDPTTSGQLYGGEAAVTALPSAEGGHILTRDGVVICPGDSGGSAYVISGGAPVGNPRAIVGVNSGYLASGRVSAIAAFTPAMAAFVRDWSARAGVAIRGVHAEAKNCRDPYSP